MKKMFHFNTISFNGRNFRLIPNYSFFNTSKLNYKAAEIHMKEFEEISSNSITYNNINILLNCDSKTGDIVRPDIYNIKNYLV